MFYVYWFVDGSACSMTFDTERAAREWMNAAMLCDERCTYWLFEGTELVVASSYPVLVVA
jgi:hypothetical protein